MMSIRYTEGNERRLIMNGFLLNDPAKTWCEGALCGNGTIGAVVMGIPQKEQIILNHEEVFAPVFGYEKPIPMAAYFPEIRERIMEGKYREAGNIPWKIFQQNHMDKLWTNPFIPAGDLLIETKRVTEVTGYQRSLNFETGVAGVSFISNEVIYERRVFASYSHRKLYVELSARDGRTGRTQEEEYLIHLEKHSGESVKEDSPYGNLYEYLQADSKAEDDTVCLTCFYGNTGDGYRISLEIPEQTGVICRNAGAGICIQAQEKVLLSLTIELLRISADKRQHMDDRQKEAENCQDRIGASESFDTLWAEEEAYRKCRGNLRLQLKEETSYADDAALYRNSRENYADAAFLNRIFEAGRYAIRSSNGNYPSNLQGIWNGSYDIPWSSDYTQDGNLQTAILGLLPCGDFKGMKSFVRYQESLVEAYRENSRILYGCRGIHVPTRTSDSGYDIHFDETWPMLFWISGAGWNARFFYDYWLYTGDDTFFIEHALPFMKEAALFYEDYLIEDSSGKWLFSPSYSPENTPHGKDSSVVVNATMDISVAKELLTNLISGCRTLKLEAEEENIRNWEKMLDKMPPYLINEDGALKEWAWEDLEDEYDHRHLSQLYLLFYDIPTDVRNDPQLFHACKKAYEIKMERKKKERGSMAFGLVQAGMVAAHLQDSAMTEILLQSMARNNYYPTFASSHDYGPSTFNVDISGGLPALMLECIAQSFPILKEDYSIDHFEIRLLPALPGCMKTGEVDGLRLRGGFQLYLRWKDGLVEEYRLDNPYGQKYVI